MPQKPPSGLTWASHPASFRRSPGGRKKAPSGFSLVEVALAIGVVAFAFVALFGLLPTGMTISRQAIEGSVASQIAQRVINDAQQSDFAELIKDAGGSPITGTNQTGRKAERYFDEQGTEVTAANKAQAIYHVNTRITPATAMPKTGTSTGDNVNLAVVTVQVANNPANRPLALSTDSSNDQDKPLRNLWTGAYADNPSKY